MYKKLYLVGFFQHIFEYINCCSLISHICVYALDYKTTILTKSFVLNFFFYRRGPPFCFIIFTSIDLSSVNNLQTLHESLYASTFLLSLVGKKQLHAYYVVLLSSFLRVYIIHKSLQKFISKNDDN
jgi:hypothetical protein